MNDYDSLLHTLGGFATRIQAVNRQAVREYAPTVESILRSQSRDASHIDHILDGLLGFCAYEPALVLFKRLCRHYWEIHPAATVWHIDAYREMWESNDNECLSAEAGGA